MVSVKVESSPSSTSAPLARNQPGHQKSPKRKPGFSNTSELVTLISQELETRFVLHKDFATHYSSVLRTAFNSPHIEGKTQTYRFRAADAETIQFLVHWIYNQNFSVEYEGPEGTDEKLTAYWRFRALVRLWVVAAELKIPRLQNEIIRDLENMRATHGCHGTRLFYFVYLNTPKGSSLRKYIAHAAVNLSSKFLEDNISAFPKEMLHDMTVLFMAHEECRERVLKPLEIEKNTAQYQVPKDGER